MIELILLHLLLSFYLYFVLLLQLWHTI